MDNFVGGTASIAGTLLKMTYGTSHDFVFQISHFSTLADIFAYLETPPMDYNLWLPFLWIVVILIQKTIQLPLCVWETLNSVCFGNLYQVTSCSIKVITQ